MSCSCFYCRTRERMNRISDVFWRRAHLACCILNAIACGALVATDHGWKALASLVIAILCGTSASERGRE